MIPVYTPGTNFMLPENFRLRAQRSRSISDGRTMSECRRRSRPSGTLRGEFSLEPPPNERNHFSGSQSPSDLWWSKSKTLV